MRFWQPNEQLHDDHSRLNRHRVRIGVVVTMAASLVPEPNGPARMTVIKISFTNKSQSRSYLHRGLQSRTYFSSSGGYKIPSDMPGVDYEETEKGVYLSISLLMSGPQSGGAYEPSSRWPIPLAFM